MCVRVCLCVCVHVSVSVSVCLCLSVSVSEGFCPVTITVTTGRNSMSFIWIKHNNILCHTKYLKKCLDCEKMGRIVAISWATPSQSHLSAIV